MFGNSRNYEKQDFKRQIRDITAQYEALIFDKALNPELLTAFYDRLTHAKNSGRDAERFLEEELSLYEELEMKAVYQEQNANMREEARRRRLSGDTYADQVLKEYRRRIEHYPDVEIHPDAEFEVQKLYGAMGFFDNNHWNCIEIFLRQAFPQAGQFDRMSIEQRFWRFSSTRSGRIPEALERYQRSLSTPSISNKERTREAQEAIKAVAFFLHELLEICEQGTHVFQPDEEVEKAIFYIHSIIKDFRLKNLKMNRM